MLKLKLYFTRLRACLAEDTLLFAAMQRYLGDIRAWHEEEVDDFLTVFRADCARQHALPSGLDRVYAEHFAQAAHLQMRLAFLACLEEDGQAEPLRLAGKVLEAICQAPDWVTQGKTGNPFLADLWTGSMCTQCAVVYSLVHDVLPAQTLKEIREGILRNGILPVWQDWLDPYSHAHALDSMGHNWYLVIICGAGIACLALLEEMPELEAYFRGIRSAVSAWFRYPGNPLLNKHATFGRGHDYIEYLGYMTYGFSTYAEMESLYRDMTGKDDLFEEAFLAPQVQAYLDFCYFADGRMRLANFGDTPERIVKHQVVIYYLTQCFQASSLFRMQSRMSSGPNEWEDFLFYPMARDTAQRIGFADAPHAGRMAIYPHAGYAVLRDGFADTDRFLAIRTGEGWNHNHLDCGTFILSDHGAQIAVDSGYCTYGRPEYRGYYTTPGAHNTLLIGGHGEDADEILSGTHFPGAFPRALDAGNDFRCLVCDCTGPYTGVLTRFFRYVISLRDATLFFDDIQTCEWNTSSPVTFRVHYAGEAKESGDEILLRNGVTETRFLPLYPPHPVVRFGTGLRDGENLTDLGLRDPNRHALEYATLPEGPYLETETVFPDRRGKLIHAFLRPGCHAKVSVHSGDGWACVLLDNGNRQEKLYLNFAADTSVMHRNSWLETEEIRTDGPIAYVCRESGQIVRVGCIAASALTLEGFRFGSLVKLELLADRAEGIAHIISPMEVPATLGFDGNETELSLRYGKTEVSLC